MSIIARACLFHLQVLPRANPSLFRSRTFYEFIHPEGEGEGGSANRAPSPPNSLSPRIVTYSCGSR